MFNDCSGSINVGGGVFGFVRSPSENNIIAPLSIQNAHATVGLCGAQALREKDICFFEDQI